MIPCVAELLRRSRPLPADRAGMRRRITIYLGRAVKFRGDRADLHPHLACNEARARLTADGRPGEAGCDRGHVRKEAPHLVERVVDDEALVESRLRGKIDGYVLGDRPCTLRLGPVGQMRDRTNPSVLYISTRTMIGAHGPERGPASAGDR